jgi:hypothetical protein
VIRRISVIAALTLSASARPVEQQVRLPLPDGVAVAELLILDIVGGPRVRVEWLEIAASGEAKVLVAREFDSGLLQLPVGQTDARFLRFSWEGGSFTTVPAAALSRQTATRIVKPPAGGELVGLIERAAVLPDRYRLESATTRLDLRPVVGTIAVSGLPPGSYTLVPQYAGGISGAVLPIRIERGRSTIVALRPEDVGAVEAVAGSTVCAETNRLTVSRIEQKGTRTAEFAVARAGMMGNCTARVAGLAPGQYRVTFDRPSPRFAASAPVEVAAQIEAHVSVDSPIVHVFGTVLVNGKPPIDLTLSFRPTNHLGPPDAEAPVGPGGIFDVTLPEAGQYHVVPVRRSIAILGSDRTEVFEVGPNQFDLSLEGGSVVLELVNWDKSLPVTLQLDSLQTVLGRSTQSEFSVLTTDPQPVALDGIGFGRYRVKARQRRQGGDVLVSESREFTIDENDPSEEIELRLERYDSRLVLRTSGGEPVRGATARIDSLTQLEETEPGVYEISGEKVVPGEAIQIFAVGFAPTCRVAPAAGVDLVVVADQGVPTMV